MTSGWSGGSDPADPVRRIEVVDALRGFALLGILQVNIQSYTWGAGDALGALGQPPGAAESILYFLQSAFVEGKFYPIFAFLFGFGMALQLRKLRRAGDLDADAARTAYRRRLAFLLAIGLAHGLLLYFGDVLAAYALCGLLFLQWTDAPAPARTRIFVRFTWIAAAASLASLFVPLLFDSIDGGGAAADADGGEAAYDALLAVHEIYSTGGYLVALRQRLADDVWQQVGSILTFWPQVLALFALGAIAGRQGWLHRPERHVTVWRRAWIAGLALGLPCALAGAALCVVAARSAPGAQSGWGDVVSGAGSLLACAYVAAAMRLLPLAGARRLRRALACAGRASLSNYLLQSLFMGALLSGWGLRLGASASRGELACLGVAIFAAQVLASSWWLRRHRQGPMEAIWRRWTYGR